MPNSGQQGGGYDNLTRTGVLSLAIPITARETDYAQVAAAAVAAAAVARPCQFASVVVTTPGTAQLDFYDAASATGQPIYSLAASAPRGRYEVGVPCGTGIFVNSGANSPAVTITYA